MCECKQVVDIQHQNFQLVVKSTILLHLPGVMFWI